MESTGPIRPNVITRWTKFQAQEHPEQYDLDDGIIVTSNKKKNSNKFNLRKEEQHELYGDSIVIKVEEKEQQKPIEEKKDPNKPFHSRVKVELFMESLSISNQNIESIESNRIIKFLINHCKRYAQLPKPQSVIASINQLPQATITIINSNIISSQQQQINNQNENMNSSINTVFDINNMQYRQEIANGWVNLKQDFNQNHL